MQGVEETFNFLSQSTNLTMGSSNAREYGGAVYVRDSDPIFYCFPDRANLEKCFFQVDGSYRFFRVIFAIHFFLIQQLPCIGMSPLDIKLEQFSTSV